MKRNLIIIRGVALLIITGLFIPVASFSQKAFYMHSVETTSLTNGASIGIGLIILWFMQSNSKWRGVLWILLSIVGVSLTFLSTQREYERIVNRELRIDPAYPYGPLSYDSGIYLILLGYLIVMIGSIWDIVQKGKEENSNMTSSQAAHQEVSRN
jgi:hypothetical protein